MNKRRKVKPHLLHYELMLDIFSKLPTKSLCRFRCVSKDFLNYISSPSLHQLRYHQSSKKPFSISMALLKESDYLRAINPIYRTPDIEVEQQLSLSASDHEGQPISHSIQNIKIDGWNYIYLMPSHYNLVCITTQNHIYICSPSKQEFVELPKGSDFMSTSQSFGFGYLPSKDEYKVVRIFFRNRDREEINNCKLGCEILTISNYGGGRNNALINSCSAWRVLEEGCPHVMDEWPVLFNGSVHWRIDSLWEREEDEQIMSFNLEDEKFWILPVPECVKINPFTFKLAELRKELWLNHFEGGNPHVMNMWLLKDFDTFTWIKEYSIDVSVINKSLHTPEESTLVWNINPNGELVISMRGNLFCYNIKTKSFTDLGKTRKNGLFCYYVDG